MIFRPIDIHSDWHFPKSVCKNSDLKWAWAAMQYLVNIHVIHHVTNLSSWSAFHTWTLEAAASLPCYAFACYISSTTLQLSFCITSCSSVFDQLFVSTDWWVASIVSLNLKRRKKSISFYRHLKVFLNRQAVPGGKCTPIFKPVSQELVCSLIDNKCFQFFVPDTVPLIVPLTWLSYDEWFILAFFWVCVFFSDRRCLCRLFLR